MLLNWPLLQRFMKTTDPGW